jgi:GAF domain-containing protein
LAELARLATEDLNPGAMQQRITDALAREFGWDFVALIAVDRERERFVCQALTTRLPTDIHVGYSRALGSGVVGRVAADGVPILVGEASEFRDFVHTLPGARAELAVPIRHRGEVIGVLNLESLTPHVFDDQLALLQTIADQIAGAIHGARAHDEMARRADLLELVAAVARDALADLPQETLLARALQQLAQRYATLEATVLLESDLREHLEVAAHVGNTPQGTWRGKLWPVNRGVVGRCFRSGEPQRVVDVRTDPDYATINPVVRSELAIPIRGRGRVFGVLNLEAEEPTAFDALNRLLLHTLADQLGAAIDLAVARQRLAHSEALRDRQEQRLRESHDHLRRATAQIARRDADDPDTGLPGAVLFLGRARARLRRAQRDLLPAALLLLTPAADTESLVEFGERVRGMPELARASLGRWSETALCAVVDGAAAERLSGGAQILAERSQAKIAVALLAPDRLVDLDLALHQLAQALAHARIAVTLVDLSHLSQQRPRRGRPARAR